jgi:hypothetical protein
MICNFLSLFMEIFDISGAMQISMILEMKGEFLFLDTLTYV